MIATLNNKKFNDIFSKALQVDSSEINDQMSPQNVPSWDSFNSLMLITELEKGFGIHFKMKEVTSIKNVADIKTILKKNGVELWIMKI